MITKVRIAATSVFVLVSMLLTGSSYAIRTDWTEAEKQCAASIGVTIGRVNYKHPDAGPKTLAWISDLVVRGSVIAVNGNLEGPYHTHVVVQVKKFYKGTAPSSITVMLMSGPAYDSGRNEILTSDLVHEPRFAVGEDVLLFLTDDYHQSSVGDAQRYMLEAGQYTPVVKGKYLVDSSLNQIRNAAYPDQIHPINSTLEDIVTAVARQAANCQ